MVGWGMKEMVYVLCCRELRRLRGAWGSIGELRGSVLE